MNNSDFFEALGYLSNPSRQCKLDAEMPANSRSQFESLYYNLTGIRPQSNNLNYYILHQGADKWGVELRIYFTSSVNVPELITNMIVTPRPSTIYNARINNNEFIWRLIEYGFLLGETQNVERIRNRIPFEHLGDFENGFELP